MSTTAYRRAWAKSNPEKIREYNRKWHEKHPGLKAAWQKAYRKKHPEKYLYYRRKQRYGISKEDYVKLHKKQRGVCAICSRVSQNGQLVIDHDHRTGTIRGLLCHNCNLTLGKFEDRPDWFLNAAKYVKKAR